MKENTNNEGQSSKIVKKSSNALALIIITISVLLVLGGIIAYFALRPDLKSLKISSVSYEQNSTLVNVNIESNKDYVEIYVKDFAIYSGNSPISANAIYYDKYYYNSFNYNKRLHSKNIVLEIKFDLSKYDIDMPLKVSYRGNIIT